LNDIVFVTVLFGDLFDKAELLSEKIVHLPHFHRHQLVLTLQMPITLERYQQQQSGAADK